MVLETSIEFGPGQSEMINRYSIQQGAKKAMEFLNELKGRLIEDKFHEFGKALLDCRAKRIEITDFMEKAKKILEGHQDLLLRFNFFMPIGYKFKLPVEVKQSQQKKHVKMEDATSFLNKIRAKFQGVDDHIYKSCIKILIMYYKKHISFTKVCKEITTLLQHHPDLLDEFLNFLPKATSSRYVAAQNSVHGDI
ncbi:paired amphipathic helix protein Sin3-like 4 [Vicia villosa]|uniref:paired amphipathic helix protein Sin3-like 4 n=1 Tax=Vicia villosa TaxID=3911 RepID=UPI00273C7278|nr:paired amphipathic helix protein Sin3-like 4 [Vicia villosa]